MLLDTHTTEPASSRSPAEFVSGPPWMRSSISSTVDHSAPITSTETSPIDSTRSSRARRVTERGSAAITATSNTRLDRGEHPLRAQPNVVGQEHGQHHRGDDRARHRPARLGSRGLAAHGFHPPYPRAATPERESSPLDDVAARPSAKDRGDEGHLTWTRHSRSRRSTSRGSSSRRRRSTTSSSCR